MDVKNKNSFTFGRLAMILLMLCLITTCCVSATFAKYVTSGTATDSARVAKWGMEISIEGTLFGTEYGSVSVGGESSVSSSNGMNVLAPGTENVERLKIFVKGTPEVSFKLEVTNEPISDVYLAKGTYGVMIEVTNVNSNSDLSSLYVLDNGSYVAATTYNEGVSYYRLADKVSVSDTKVYPVDWRLYNAADSLIDDGTLEQMLESLKEVLNKTYQPNAYTSQTYYLAWEWVMNGNDGVDTILGNIAAGSNVVVLSGINSYSPITSDYYSLTVDLNLTVTATQID